MSVKWRGAQPKGSHFWLMPIQHHCERKEDCQRGYDTGSAEGALLAIQAISAAGQLNDFSYVVTATAQYADVKLKADSRSGHGKIGYNLVLLSAATQQYSVVMTFGNRVGQCPDFLEGFNTDSDGQLHAGDRLFLLAISLDLEHRIRCSSVRLVFKNDVPPPTTSMTLRM